MRVAGTKAVMLFNKDFNLRIMPLGVHSIADPATAVNFNMRIFNIQRFAIPVVCLLDSLDTRHICEFQITRVPIAVII